MLLDIYINNPSLKFVDNDDDDDDDDDNNNDIMIVIIIYCLFSPH